MTQSVFRKLENHSTCLIFVAQLETSSPFSTNLFLQNWWCETSKKTAQIDDDDDEAHGANDLCLVHLSNHNLLSNDDNLLNMMMISDLMRMISPSGAPPAFCASATGCHRGSPWSFPGSAEKRNCQVFSSLEKAGDGTSTVSSWENKHLTFWTRICRSVM